MKRECIADGGDVFEVDRVWDFEAFHAVGVPPLLEMHLEGPAAPIAVVAAYLALVLDAQSVKFVEPVGNGLAVPAERQVLRVVDWRIGFLALRGRLFVLLDLLVASGLFLSHQVHSIIDD